MKPKDKTPFPQDPRSKPISLDTPPAKEGYVFVQDADGTIHILPNGSHMHPKVLGGAKPGAAAGEVFVGEGKTITELNNISGTFPFKDPAVLERVAESLRQMGFKVPPEAIKYFKP
jgi:hypothetical protein